MCIKAGRLREGCGGLCEHFEGLFALVRCALRSYHPGSFEGSFEWMMRELDGTLVPFYASILLGFLVALFLKKRFPTRAVP